MSDQEPPSPQQPTLTDLIRHEMRETGEWGRHPWWAASADFLAASELTPEIVERAFGRLGCTFPAAWVRRKVTADDAHWFPKWIQLPMRHVLEPLTELGLALAHVESVSSAAFTALQRSLKKDDTPTGPILETVVAGMIARSGCGLEAYPAGRGEKLLDIRALCDPSLDVEVKVLSESRKEAIGQVAMSSLSTVLLQRMDQLDPTPRYIRIDLSEHAVSLLSAPSEQSKLDVASLEAHATGVAAELFAALQRHRVDEYAREEVAGVTLESWPREHEGKQLTVLGPVIESRDVAERLYRNALLDAAEKFADRANGVVFVGLDSGPVHLGYFAGIWRAALRTNVFRNVAAVVVSWRGVEQTAFDRRDAVIFPNPSHGAVEEVCAMLRGFLAAPRQHGLGPVRILPAPPPDASQGTRMLSLHPWIIVPPLSEKTVVVVPHAEPPVELVERFLRIQR